MLYKKELAGVTLGQLHASLKDDAQTWQGDIAALEMNVTGETPTIVLPARGEIPFPHHAQQQLASQLKIPRGYYDRMPTLLRQTTLDTLATSTDAEVHIDFLASGIENVSDPGKVILRPGDIMETLLDRMPEESTIVDVVHSADDFQVDVLYGDESNQVHIGGDLEVGDITRGGVRVGYSMKSQGKPWVSPYLYRLMCTNGMETPEMSLKLTTDGKGPQEYLTALGNFTESALGMVKSRIDAYYRLRDAEIDVEPSVALANMAASHGLPDAVVKRLVSHLPVSPTNTVFDLINILTNEANNPVIEERPNQRRKLQRAGGSVVVHQSGFCDTCGGCT